MLEKIKEVPFIDESGAVKVTSAPNGKIVLERSDRVIWAQEVTQLVSTGIDCYVEASKFFALIGDIKELNQSTCLEVVLKNGARYELPFIETQWEPVDMPTQYDDVITFKLEDLMLCTLKNLVKPELQCIYIDELGAVSCDFISACLSDIVKAKNSFLLPPDVQELVNNRQCEVKITDDKLYFRSSDFVIATTKPDMSGDPWWESLRAMTDGAQNFTKAEPLVNSLHRLQLFSDYVTFDGEKAISGSNFEPFKFKDLSTIKYEIERLTRLSQTAHEITELSQNLILKNRTSTFLISPTEEA